MMPARRQSASLYSAAVRSGFVLIVILVIVMLMSVAAYGFLLAMQTENIAARTSGDQLIAQQHAESGMEWMSALLELPREQREALTAGRDPRELFLISLEDEEETSQQKEMASVCLIMQPLPHRPEELTELPWGMINESAKLNLMTILEWEKRQPGAGRLALLRLPGMTGPDADAILDWVDADSQPRVEGAEAEVYSILPTPYLPRNGQPLGLEELQLVRGVDGLRLWGKSAADVESRNRPPPRSEVESGSLPWSHWLTVCSAERNVAQDGSSRLFVNEPQLDRLHQRLSERLPAEWANFLIMYRQFGPGPTTQQTLESGQITPNLSLPAKRSIDSLLDLVAATIVMPHNGMSVTVKSPFKSDPASLQTQLPMLLDRLTVTPSPRLAGRVNINLAPKEILLGIPGIDESLAERILAARSMDRTNSAGRQHAAWLLAEGIVDLPTMRKLLPWITVGGDVFRAEFWGVQDAKSPLFRCEAVIDGSQQPAQRISIRDLPLRREWLESLVFDQK